MWEKYHFNEEWLIKDSYPEFASWLVKGKENTQAKGKLCHKVVELSNMGIQALKSYQKGKKHISNVSNMSCFFKPSGKDPPVSVEEATSKVNDISSTKQQTLELNVLSSEKISAEIMWAVHCCLNGIFNNSNQDTSADYYKPCSLIARLQNTFKWDQIKSDTVSDIALALISKVYLSNSCISPLASFCLSMNPLTKNPNMSNGLTYSI